MLNPNRYILAILFLTIALAAAYPLTRSIGNLPVDIGLDVATETGAAPSLLVDVNGDLQPLTTMARVPGKFAPLRTRFEIETAGEKHPQSAAYEIMVKTAPVEGLLDRARSFPPRYWHIGPEWSLTFGDQPTTLNYDELGGPLRLGFGIRPAGGRAVLRTPAREWTIEGYHEREHTLWIDLPAEQWTRYHARIPRRHAGEFHLQFDSDTPPIARLYINTVIPRIFFTSRVYPDAPWGIVTRDWSPEIVDGTIAIETQPIDSGGLLTYALVAAVLFIGMTALALAFSALRIVLRRARTPLALPTPAPNPFPWPLTALFFVAFIAVFSIYFAMYYPGIENGDIRVQWEEAQSMELRDNHPVLHTLLVKLLRALWDSWASVSIFQMIILAGVLSIAFAFLVQVRAPRPAIAITLVLALVSPRIGTMSVSLWKDVPYAVLVLVLTLLLARCMIDQRVRTRPAFWIAFGLTLALIPLIRHNGLAILALMTLLAGFAFAPHRRYALAAVAFAWALFLVAKLLVYPPLLARDYGGNPTPDFWLKSTVLRDGRTLLAQDPPLSPEEYDLFWDTALLQPDDRVLLYMPDRFSQPDLERAYRFKIAAMETGRLLEVRDAVRAVQARAPFLTLRNLLHERLPRMQFVYWRKRDIRWGLWVPLERTHDIIGTWDDALHRTLVEMRQHSGIFYSQPVIAFYAVLAAALVAWLRMRDARILAVYAPALVNSIAISLTVASTSDRYHFPLEIAAGFLVCLALLPCSVTGE